MSHCTAPSIALIACLVATSTEDTTARDSMSVRPSTSVSRLSASPPSGSRLTGLALWAARTLSAYCSVTPASPACAGLLSPRSSASWSCCWTFLADLVS